MDTRQFCVISLREGVESNKLYTTLILVAKKVKNTLSQIIENRMSKLSVILWKHQNTADSSQKVYTFGTNCFSQQLQQCLAQWIEMSCPGPIHQVFSVFHTFFLPKLVNVIHLTAQYQTYWNMYRKYTSRCSHNARPCWLVFM